MLSMEQQELEPEPQGELGYLALWGLSTLPLERRSVMPARRAEGCGAGLSEQFLLDSGAYAHVCPTGYGGDNAQQLPPVAASRPVVTATGSYVPRTGARRRVHIALANGDRVGVDMEELPIKQPLLSPGSLATRGCWTVIGPPGNNSFMWRNGCRFPLGENGTLRFLPVHVLPHVLGALSEGAPPMTADVPGPWLAPVSEEEEGGLPGEAPAASTAAPDAASIAMPHLETEDSDDDVPMAEPSEAQQPHPATQLPWKRRPVTNGHHAPDLVEPVVHGSRGGCGGVPAPVSGDECRCDRCGCKANASRKRDSGHDGPGFDRGGCDERGGARCVGRGGASTAAAKRLRAFLAEAGPTANCPACIRPMGRKHIPACVTRRAAWSLQQQATATTTSEETPAAATPEVAMADASLLFAVTMEPATATTTPEETPAAATPNTEMADASLPAAVPMERVTATTTSDETPAAVTPDLDMADASHPAAVPLEVSRKRKRKWGPMVSYSDGPGEDIEMQPATAAEIAENLSCLFQDGDMQPVSCDVAAAFLHAPVEPLPPQVGGRRTGRWRNARTLPAGDGETGILVPGTQRKGRWRRSQSWTAGDEKSGIPFPDTQRESAGGGPYNRPLARLCVRFDGTA